MQEFHSEKQCPGKGFPRALLVLFWQKNCSFFEQAAKHPLRMRMAEPAFSVDMEVLSASGFLLFWKIPGGVRGGER